MNAFVEGHRYPMDRQMAMAVMRQGWPIASGEPDVKRGRRFVKAPGDWEFWTKDGHKISFSVGHGSVIVSKSKSPDPELPEPLTGGADPR